MNEKKKVKCVCITLLLYLWVIKRQSAPTLPIKVVLSLNVVFTVLQVFVVGVNCFD